MSYNECPSDPDLGECVSDMSFDALCEADQALPDGTSNYDVNNCGTYDVFRCISGNITSLLINESYYLFYKFSFKLSVALECYTNIFDF